MAAPKAKCSSDKKKELPKELTVLIQRKQLLFSQIQRVYDMSHDLSNAETKQLFLLHVSEIGVLRSSFEKIIFDIFEQELILDSEAILRSHELQSFDDLYFRVKLSASKCSPTPVGNTSENHLHSVETRPRLPKLELFSFDSNIENFNTFYETFCSLVHDQPHIPKIDKFHYLLSCTKGSALNIVKSVPISSNNYDLVWQSLIDKYRDNRLLVGRYLDKMLNFSPLHKESSADLNRFIENFEHSYKAIQALNIENLNSYIICHIALRALDPQTRKCFEQKLDQNSTPSFDQLASFIQNQIKVLDHSASYSSVQSNKRQQSDPRQINTKKYSLSSTYTNNKSKGLCLHCNNNHMIFRCEQFRKMSHEKRIRRANELKLCHNCLKSNHAVKSCKSNFKCLICNLPHHVLLHREVSANDNNKPTSSQLLTTEAAPAPCKGDGQSVISQVCHVTSIHNSNYAVILGTAVVNVLDAFNNYQPVRVLIDSGAQSNFITLNCFQRLGLSSSKCPYNILGLGGEYVKNYGMASCVIQPRHCSTPVFNIDAVILPKITSDLPNVVIPVKVINKYTNLHLADPYFYKKSPIDIILSGEMFPYIYNGTKFIVNSDVPVALGSVFGYVITGRLGMNKCSSNQDVVPCATSLVSYSIESNLNDTLKRFWELESLPCEIPMDPMEELAEKIYTEKHYRDENGRYVSPILLKPNHAPIGDSYDVALNRLKQVERRLARSPDLHKAYVDFMREYESLGHMELYQGPERSGYYIPHHCVLRPSSVSTPLRVVYDGSAQPKNGIAINDALLTGRKLHQDLLNIIIRFRLYEVCFTADVSKMYRAVLIDPVDRKYQHILWRESPTEPVRVFELRTNTYGLRSAPYIAVRTLHQLADDELTHTAQPRSEAARVLKQGFYVDDVLWSCQSLKQACTLQDDLLSLLKSGGFDLRKWASNCPELLTRMQSDQIVTIDFHDDTLSSSVKVLGLTWLPACDSFAFSYNMTDNKTTKRSVLKLLASIFDPVGIISPCTFVAKCIMQDLWKLGIGWDEQLPPEPCSQWSRFISDLPLLSELRIERHMLIPNFREIQLIAFCDASSRGYATCLYLRSVSNMGEVKVRLLTSKSKVAPLNPILSIPRLELEAAVLLSKVVSFVVQNLRVNDLDFSIVALSDSKNVLAWIHTQPYMLKTFVANRVSRIITAVPPSCWYHVKGEHNAADICSRGAPPARFVDEAAKWIDGPEWLYKDQEMWPVKPFLLNKEFKIAELKSNSATFTFNSCLKGEVKNDLEETFNKFSSFYRLQRVISWCLRFMNSIRCKGSERSVGPLKTFELRQGHDAIIRVIQSNHFVAELLALEKGKFVASLRKLSPFVDQKVLRVGGRISQSDLPYNTKHPVLLPKCHTSKLLIEYLHVKYLHIGPRTLQGIMCKNYWLVGARSIIRSVLSKCKVCFKCQPTAIQPKMGTLPMTRLKPGKVFSHVGTDIGGPFFVKESTRRNAKVYKAYLCLFVCFSTKAVHCEVLTDLSTECFLAAYDRFVARRGLSTCLYSDCGTNYVSAAKHLKEVAKFLNNNKIQDEILVGLTTRQVEWRTNPPNAASMGGLWEAGIKSTKHILQRIVGDRTLTLEELSTVFCRIEAVLNSRPLCTLSSNPNEFDVLTAGHFLIGQSLVAVPEYDYEDVPQHRITRWQSIQKISQSFWRRWSNDYLHTLQQREKWFSSPPNVKVGDLVLLKSNLTRPLQWPLGRIETTHKGGDGIIRVVTLRTKNGLIKRPVNKICPLPYAN